MSLCVVACWCVCLCVRCVFVCLCVCVCVFVCAPCVLRCVWRLGTQKKKPPCVDSKRPRVYRHHAHMCYHMRAWCRHTRGRSESKHGGSLDGHTGRERGGGVTVSSAHRNLDLGLSRASERFTERNPWISQIFSLRIGREQHVPESSNHSLYLMKLLSSIYPGETLEGTSREMVRFVFRSNENKYSERFARWYLLKPPLEFLLTLPCSRCVHHLSRHTPHTHTYIHTHTYRHIHIDIYMYIYIYLYRHIHIYIYLYIYRHTQT